MFSPGHTYIRHVSRASLSSDVSLIGGQECKGFVVATLTGPVCPSYALHLTSA